MDAALRRTATFTFEGREWTVSELSHKEHALFRAWLEQEAYRFVQRFRSYADADDYQAQLEGLRHDAATGYYSWGGEGSAKALKTPMGVGYVAMLSTRPAHGTEFTEEMLSRLAVSAEGLRSVTEAFESANSNPLVAGSDRTGV